MAHQELRLEDIPSGHPVALFAEFWDQAAAGRPAPEWSAFDAVDHPKILPWVLLLKPEPGGVLRYAICGTGCAALFGMSFDGMEFGDGMPADAVEIRRREFARAQAGEAPLYSRASLPIEHREFIDVYRGVFPFLAADGSLQRMLVVVCPVEGHRRVGY